MGSATEQELILAPLVAGTSVIDELRVLIRSRYPHLFKAVIVHGSVGTAQIIKYSDFDGLLIIKKKYVGSSEYSDFIKRSMAIILRFDPLQHHGWFEIPETQLSNYPEQYLPTEVLVHSKLIFPEDVHVTLNVSVTAITDYTASMESTILVFTKRLEMKWRPANIYQLKSFLSEIMLLPTLYYSHLNKAAIFKGKSFEVVKPLFVDDEWEVITIATRIRREWEYELNPLQKWIMQRPERVFRKLTEKIVAPLIPKPVLKQMNKGFYGSLEKMIIKMKNSI